jgi:hypothetical protein
VGYAWDRTMVYATGGLALDADSHTFNVGLNYRFR